jgi:hypothetical protein
MNEGNRAEIAKVKAAKLQKAADEKAKATATEKKLFEQPTEDEASLTAVKACYAADSTHEEWKNLNAPILKSALRALGAKKRSAPMLKPELIRSLIPLLATWWATSNLPEAIGTAASSAATASMNEVEERENGSPLATVIMTNDED